MNRTIIAQFDSIDMATIAARNVADRIKGITDINVSYKKSQAQQDDTPFANFFIPQNYMSGVFVNENLSYPADVVGDHERTQDITQIHAFVEIKTSNDYLRNIESNLRAYGGRNIKVI